MKGFYCGVIHHRAFFEINYYFLRVIERIEFFVEGGNRSKEKLLSNADKIIEVNIIKDPALKVKPDALAKGSLS